MSGEFLTIDVERDLGLPYSDPRDDGLAYVLAGVRLAHWLQMQLVAVTQNLWGSGEKKVHKYKQGKGAKQRDEEKTTQ